MLQQFSWKFIQSQHNYIYCQIFYLFFYQLKEFNSFKPTGEKKLKFIKIGEYNTHTSGWFFGWPRLTLFSLQQSDTPIPLPQLPFYPTPFILHYSPRPHWNPNHPPWSQPNPITYLPTKPSAPNPLILNPAPPSSINCVMQAFKGNFYFSFPCYSHSPSTPLPHPLRPHSQTLALMAKYF